MYVLNKILLSYSVHKLRRTKKKVNNLEVNIQIDNHVSELKNQALNLTDPEYLQPFVQVNKTFRKHFKRDMESLAS